MKQQQHQYQNHTNYQHHTTEFDGGREGGEEDDDAVNRNSVSSEDGRCGGLAATGCAHSGVTSITTLFQLPLTFWIVAIARAIFLVTFKVFSRYSNSFLIVSSFPTIDIRVCRGWDSFFFLIVSNANYLSVTFFFFSRHLFKTTTASESESESNHSCMQSIPIQQNTWC